MKKIAGVTYEEVYNEALMVARYTYGYRAVAPMPQLEKMGVLEDEDVKDLDFLNFAAQPEKFHKFFDEFMRIQSQIPSEFLTIPEMFEKYGHEEVVA